MKYLITILVSLSLSFTAAATDWGGIWNTNFGEVRLVQKGKVIVGTYGEFGHVIVHTISGNTVNGIFFNKGKLGDFQWTRNGYRFSGKWAWKGKPLAGSWTGTAVRRTGFLKYEGIWETTYGNIHFVQNGHNQMAGTYGAKGWVIGSYNPTTKILKGTYSNNGVSNLKPFEMKFNGITFSGKYEQTAWGSWKGTQKSWKRNLVVTLQSLKLYKANGLGKTEKGKVDIMAKIFDAPINKLDTYLLQSTQNITLSEGQSKNYNNTRVKVPVLVYKGKLVEPESLSLQFKYMEYRKINNALDTYQANDIDLQEITRFLTGNKALSSFQNGPDGRKRVPNTSHTFWLKDYGNNNRTARGYGFVNFNEKQKWGYFYTIALETI